MGSLLGFVSGSARPRAAIFAAILATACALALAACGGEQRTAPSCQLPDNRVAPAIQPAISLDDTLAEIDAYPCPDGVEPELWTMLKQELANCLLSRASSTSTMPFYETNDFSVKLQFDGVVWTGPILWGDGSRDGVVSIADLTPIALNYGRTIEEGEEYLDYDEDHRVNIEDVTVLAQNWGRLGDTYTVEWSDSLTARYDLVTEAAYQDFRAFVWNGAEYFVPLEARGQRNAYVRVTRAHREGVTTSYQTIDVAFSHPSRAPREIIRDLATVEGIPDTITWTTQGVIPDGNQNGLTELFDSELVFVNFGAYMVEQPSLAVVDYDLNGDIGLYDYVLFIREWGSCITDFRVEVSATSPFEGFSLDDEVDYFEDCTGFTEYGFRFYEYQIQSPPEGPYWVRVTPSGEAGIVIMGVPLLVGAE